ncbi:hypothetical protein ACU4GD_45175 [Cupriavidus basilensis]
MLQGTLRHRHGVVASAYKDPPEHAVQSCLAVGKGGGRRTPVRARHPSRALHALAFSLEPVVLALFLTTYYLARAPRARVTYEPAMVSRAV